MSLRSLIPHFAASLAVLASLGAAPDTRAAEARQVTEPVTHDNLTVYFIKGRSESGPVPLTLDEALGKGNVTVHETQQVSELEIENTGDEAVLVHAGDIVKGGQQDRVLTVTILVPPKSGRVPIASYCVERGRWAARGAEEVATFASSKAFMPSLEGKRAMRSVQKAKAVAALAETQAAPSAAPHPEGAEPAATTGSVSAEPEHLQDQVAEPRGEGRFDRRVEVLTIGREPNRERIRPQGPDAQGEVWKSVETMQSALGMSLSANVAADASPTSLQLALENEELMKAQAAYIDTLKPKGETGDDVIGLVIAINGELKSADVYPSNGLFRKYWDKHLQAAATEAIGRRDETRAAALPAKSDVEAFLSDADGGNAHREELNQALDLEVLEGAKAEAYASRTKAGRLLHMNYLAKK